MRIIHISDTHNVHQRLNRLPEGDVIVHSGDFTMAGTEAEALDFMEWFCDLPYRHKVFIAGNHDFCLRGAALEGLDDNCHYLCNSGVLIEGVKFYGVPMFFEDAVTGQVENDFKNIPAGTDVLVTHQPPNDILDLSDEIRYGDSVLWQRVMQVRPKLHLFGHIHKAEGVEERNGTVFSNGAVLGEGYDLTDTDIHVLTLDTTA